MSTIIEESRNANIIAKITEYAHHGEILQGIFTGKDEKYHRGLITLKCNIYKSTAVFIKELGMKQIKVFPEGKSKAKFAAEKALQYINMHTQYGGYLILQGNIPEEWGFGSSTSNVVASIKAVLSEFNIILKDEEIARIAVEAECASDSIMFNECVLFAHREGIVLERYHQALPPARIVGFNISKFGKGINTLEYKPAVYTKEETEKFRILRGVFRKGMEEQDLELIGAVATASAKINQSYLPKPYFNELQEVLERTQALGIQISHSGNIVGYIYPDKIDIDIKREEVKKELSYKNVKISSIWSYNA